MKKHNQIETKNSRSKRESQPRMQLIPVFTMDQFRNMPDPATRPIPRRILSGNERRRFRFRKITLTLEQASRLGPGLPTMRSFKLIATRTQLKQIRGTVPYACERIERGPSQGEVSFTVIANPPQTARDVAYICEHGTSAQKRTVCKKLKTIVEQIEAGK